MAYAGICGTDNTAAHSDAIFHAVNLDEILTFVTTGNGNTCATSTATGNTAPVVTVPGNYTIPYLTPFSLTGSATDVDGNYSLSLDKGTHSIAFRFVGYTEESRTVMGA